MLRSSAGMHALARRLWRGAFALLLFAGTARAQSDYDSALDRALQAYATGSYEQARTFMERAHALEPSARTLRGLGIIAFAQGRHLDALALLEESLVAHVRPLTPELCAAVEELLARIWTRVGRVRLTLDPPASSVSIDGALPRWHGAGELVLEPGRYRLQVSADGYARYEVDITAQPGVLQTLHVALAPRAALPAASVTRLPEVAAVRAESRLTAPIWWTPTVRGTSYALGAGAAATGLALWLAAWRKFEDVDAWCAALPAGGCTQEEAETRFEREGVRTYVRAAAVVGAFGGAALVGSVWLDVRRQRLQLGLAHAALRF